MHVSYNTSNTHVIQHSMHVSYNTSRRTVFGLLWKFSRRNRSMNAVPIVVCSRCTWLRHRSSFRICHLTNLWFQGWKVNNFFNRTNTNWSTESINIFDSKRKFTFAYEILDNSATKRSHHRFMDMWRSRRENTSGRQFRLQVLTHCRRFPIN